MTSITSGNQSFSQLISIRRTADLLPAGHTYIDIADRDPSQPPAEKGVRYSVYSDPSGFMEIEAAGGCPNILIPGTTLSVGILTEYTLS